MKLHRKIKAALAVAGIIKWIGTQDVSVEDFSLRDAKGQEVKIWRGDASSSGMAYRDVCIIHLLVAEPRAAQPWTLRFKSKPKTMVSVDVTIAGIEPQKRVVMNSTWSNKDAR
jgi:hypothetical protein